MDQVSLINQLSDCIDHHKVIKLQMEWLDGKSESILFEPYLIGENPVSAWTFIYGKALEKTRLISLPVPFIVSFIETGDGFTIEETGIFYFISNTEKCNIILSVPELQILNISEPEVKVGNLDDFFIDVPELYFRGWTESLINKFLGSAHLIKSVDHWLNYSGKRTYFLGCIEKIEKSQIFNDAFTKSFDRRKLTADKNRAFSKAREKTAGKLKSYIEKLSPKEFQDQFDKFDFVTSIVTACVYEGYAASLGNFVWFPITLDLTTKKNNEPINIDEKLLYWVKKSYDPKDDLRWYNYELLDNDFRPTQLKEGSFTCVQMYEIVPKDSRDYYWFGFEIVDRDNVTRKNELMCKGEEGIVEIIKMMRKAANYGSWDNYDRAIKKLNAVGYVEETLDDMVWEKNLKKPK